MYCTLGLVVFAVPSVAGARGDNRPNILFMMSDDHTTQAFGCYGSRFAGLNPTPNIDGLAREGMRFDRVFCTNAICTPSRASIITGQYPQTNGVLDLDGQIDPEDQHLAHEMRRADYHTAMIGKWHLKAEPAAFEYYCVLPNQGKYKKTIFRTRGRKHWPENTIERAGLHSSDAITDLSIEWLKDGWDSERPFFLMHHFKAPHGMFVNAARTYYRYWMHMAHKLGTPAHFRLRTERFELVFFYGTDHVRVPTDRTELGWGMTHNPNGNRYYANTPLAWEPYDLQKRPQGNAKRIG